MYQTLQPKADAIMEAKGFDKANWLTKKFEGDDHSEKSWSQRFAIPMVFLLGKN